ncbi:hypothetical protein BMW23_0295 [Bodo saltans virus]|uniref:Uncharacterized protein n=1 Tax=Bodo saltans virus TaxID=2024608 RepID=A0A2H4UTS9_9VIRU|nr:hypothetical protein QJ851_gp0290 [Bodo saltans virus]ATZ80353.1 hypothetical protein BMW23_0295 [Bodo saltans virus]
MYLYGLTIAIINIKQCCIIIHIIFVFHGVKQKYNII